MGEPRGRGYEGDSETNRHVETSVPEITGVNGGGANFSDEMTGGDRVRGKRK